VASILYSAAIRFYGSLLRLAAASGNTKAKAWVIGRRDWKNRLDKALAGRKGWIWFHCASLGEFEQGRPVLEEYRRRHPEKHVLLTFFSPSGYEVRKDYKGADVVCYLPLDTTGNVSAFVGAVNPEKVFFIKYEYWFNLLRELNKRDIPVYLVSSIFRKGQWFFHPLAGSFLRQLRKVRHFFVQDPGSEKLLRSAGISQVTVSGDTRFDRVMTVSSTGAPIDWPTNWKKNRTLLVAGSTWPKDEALLLDLIKSSDEELLLLLVPHETDPRHLAGIDREIARLGMTDVTQRLSDIKTEPKAFTRIIVVDRIGLLSRLYKHATVAYIGGGFGVGIHNTLEAAVYGVPLLFGPNYLKFSEAIGLVACGGAVSVQNKKELSEGLGRWLKNIDARNLAGKAAGEFVESRTGATNRILDAI
jgi:3-deoxy-D-manno-octulosonic-acid transferase